MKHEIALRSFATLQFILKPPEEEHFCTELKIKLGKCKCSSISKDEYLHCNYLLSEFHFPILMLADVREITIIHDCLVNPLYSNTAFAVFSAIKFFQEETVELTICNRSNKQITFSPTLSTEEEDLMLDKRIINVDKNSIKHFSCDKGVKSVEAKGSIKLKLTFQPIIYDGMEISEDILPPFSVSVRLSLGLEEDPVVHMINVYAVGYIKGPEIDIPREISIPPVYYGEEHCGEIRVINIDCKFYDCRSRTH